MDILMIGGILLCALAIKLLIGFCQRQIQK